MKNVIITNFKNTKKFNEENSKWLNIKALKVDDLY